MGQGRERMSLLGIALAPGENEEGRIGHKRHKRHKKDGGLLCFCDFCVFCGYSHNWLTLFPLA